MNFFGVGFICFFAGVILGQFALILLAYYMQGKEKIKK